MYLKVREDFRVRSRGVIIAVGINRDGYREVLGMMVGDTESEASWGEFFSRLKDRGLHGVNIVTSYNHRSLVRAIRQHFAELHSKDATPDGLKDIERLNEEIRRRERVIRIFPNRESVIRLLGALLMEQGEK